VLYLKQERVKAWQNPIINDTDGVISSPILCLFLAAIEGHASFGVDYGAQTNVYG